MRQPAVQGWMGGAARGLRVGAIGLAILVLLTAPALRPAWAQEGAQEGAPEAPEVCRIGVNLEDLYDLDMSRDTFGAILWIWSLCPSDEVSPLGSIMFPTASTGLNLSPVDVVALPSGGQYASRRVQGTFRFNWDMNSYPFDRQHIVIPFDETRYGAARVTFEPDVVQSFVTPDVRDRLGEWRVSELALAASVSEEPSTYGLPDQDGARYARFEVSLDLERAHLLTFLKLTSGVFAGVFIAFLSFFYDPNDRSGFGGKLGLLVGVLFAVLVNLRAADSSLGDTGHLTLITKIHMVTLVLIVVLAMVALRDRRRVERGLQVRHPNWPALVVIGGGYMAVVAGMILIAAWS